MICGVSRDTMVKWYDKQSEYESKKILSSRYFIMNVMVIKSMARSPHLVGSELADCLGSKRPQDNGPEKRAG